MYTFYSVVFFAGILLPAYGRNPKEMVKGFLENWKKSDVIELPGLDIPDPFDMADFEGAGATFTNNSLSGLSRIQIVSFKVEQDVNNTFQAKAVLFLPEFLLKGYYKYSTFWSTYEGPYSANISGVMAETAATPIVDDEGILQFAKIEPDLSYDSMIVKLEGATGLFTSVLQTLTNSLNPIIFNFVKPTLIGIVNEKLISKVNEEMGRKLKVRFPNSVSLFDSFFANERTKVLPHKMYLQDESIGASVKINFTDGYLEGLRTIHRAGPLRIMLVNHTFHLLAELEAGYLQGGYNWVIPLWFTEYTGKMKFTVHGFRVLIDLSQPANIEKHAELEQLKIHIDHISVMVDGIGFADYLLEFAVNVLPNLLKDSLYSRLGPPIAGLLNLFLEQHTLEGYINLHLE